MDYDYFMSLALEEAKKAYDKNEVPIGCIIVMEGEIIGKGHNLRNSLKNALYHAELIAIDEACKKIDDWRLENAAIFITVEPCAMCAGAIIQARIKDVVYGAYNQKFGSGGSILNILEEERFNHQCNVIKEVMLEECENIMKDFFKRFR